MPRKSAKTSLESRLDAMSALRREEDRDKVEAALREGLGEKNNLIVARAAKLTGELGFDGLTDSLEEAFERLMLDPAKRDPGAQAVEAIVIALFALDAPSEEVFSRGIRHVQMEPAYGGPVDVAIETRAKSAVGLVNSGASDPVLELVPLLVDAAEGVRMAAARAIGASGRIGAEAVLRLKVLVGDDEPEVLLECLAGLLQVAPERSLELAESFLHAKETPMRQAAILALGESRLAGAVPLLRAHHERELDRDVNRSLVLALASSRRPEAFDFLFELVAESHLGDAYPAIDALVPLLRDTTLDERLREAIERSEYRGELEQHLAKQR